MNDERAVFAPLYVVIVSLGLLFGVVQVYSSIRTYQRYVEIEESSLLGESDRWFGVLRSEFLRTRSLSGEDRNAALQKAYARHAAEGLVFGFHESPDPGTHLILGEPTHGLRLLNDLGQRGPGVRVLGETALRIQDPGFRMGVSDYIEGLPGAPEGFVLQMHRPPIFAMEFVPKRTRAMMRRARWTLGMGVAVGAAMLLGSIMLVNLLRRREQDAQELRRQELLASLGKMSAVISHELRNPLAAAMGQTELLGEVLGDDPDRALVDEAQRGLERMELVTRDLLALVNASRVSPEPTELEPWLEVVARAREHGERVEVRVEPGAPERALIDPVAMGRALDALLDNALTFGSDVSLEVRRLPSRGWELCVRDHGPGLPDELSDVFQPFVTTREDRPGLGLALAREIARAHGGELFARDEDDGALFSIVLPEQATLHG